MKKVPLLTVVFFSYCLLLVVLNCNKNVPTQTVVTAPRNSSSNTAPSSGTWFMQLMGSENAVYDSRYSVFVVDLFDATDAFIKTVHDNKAQVIAYFSAGSLENWRPDISLVDQAAIGSVYQGYDNENWLDIRASSVRALVSERLDLAKKRGFDGVDPDNVDGYTQDSGFSLSAADQINFNQFIATEAHARGLLVGLKNDLEQAAQLVTSFDFAVNEQCYDFNECDSYAPFISANKHVLAIEYADTQQDAPALCKKLVNASLAAGIQTVIATLSLDGFWSLCP